MKRIQLSLAAISLATMAVLPAHAGVQFSPDATWPVAKPGLMQLAQATNGQGQQQRQRKRQRLHQNQQMQPEQMQQDMTQTQTRTRTQTRQRMRQGR